MNSWLTFARISFVSDAVRAVLTDGDCDCDGDGDGDGDGDCDGDCDGDDDDYAGDDGDFCNNCSGCGGCGDDAHIDDHETTVTLLQVPVMIVPKESADPGERHILNTFSVQMRFMLLQMALVSLI